jgi:hypothetical protein
VPEHERQSGCEPERAPQNAGAILLDFGDRRGFVRLALRTQVPVVPAVSVGAHETLVVLTRGERLFRRDHWGYADGTRSARP